MPPNANIYEVADALMRYIHPNNAKGTKGRPFMGNTMLSKGELLFNSDGVSRVTKTDAYHLDKPTHILSSPQSYDLLKASGYPQSKLGVRSTVQQDLGRENLRKKALFGSIANHDEGTIDPATAKDLQAAVGVNITSAGDMTKKDALKEAKKYSAEGAAGGLIGLILPALLGHPLGLLGAAAGASAAIIRHSDSFKTLLFGKEVDGSNKRDGSGVLSKSVVSFIQDKFPTMLKFGLAGIIPGAITGLGILPGLFAGAGIGFLKTSDEARRGLFGDGVKIGDQQKEIINKLLPAGIKGAGVGALAGLITVGGPFGIAGGAIIGSAINMARTTDEFKDAVFGTEDKDGERVGGLLGEVGDAFSPLKDAANDLKESIKKSVQTNILQPLSDFLNPFIKEIPHLLGIIPNAINNMLENTIGLSISSLVKDYIIRPLSMPFKALTKAAGGIFKAVTSPLRLLGTVGRRIRGNQILAQRADDMTASERIDFMNNKLNNVTQRWMKKRYQKTGQKFDTFLADIGTENGATLEQAKGLMDNLGTLTDTQKGLSASKKSNEKELRDALNKAAGGLLPKKAVDEAMKKIRAGKSEDVVKILRKYALGKGKGGLTSTELDEVLGSATKGGKSIKELLTDNKSINERIGKFSNRTDKDLSDAEQKTVDMFRRMGINVDITDKKQLTKLKKLLGTEITNIEAGADRGETIDEQLSNNVKGIFDYVEKIVNEGIKVSFGDKDNKKP